jgi:hypothetical protein
MARRRRDNCKPPARPGRVLTGVHDRREDAAVDKAGRRQVDDDERVGAVGAAQRLDEKRRGGEVVLTVELDDPDLPLTSYVNRVRCHWVTGRLWGRRSPPPPTS